MHSPLRKRDAPFVMRRRIGNGNNNNGNHHGRISVATLSALVFAILSGVMLVACLYVYSQFPLIAVVDPTALKQNHHHNHPQRHAKKHRRKSSTTTIQQLRQQRLRLSSSSSTSNEAWWGMHDTAAGAAADLDGGLTEPAEMTLPQMEAKNPPRVYTCRCYPQVKYAFSQRGFRKKDNETDYRHSWIIWKTGTDIDMGALQAWQRPNHFPGERVMDRKGAMYQVLQQYATSPTTTTTSLDFVPETYVLYDDRDRARFVQRLSSNSNGGDDDDDGNGMNQPWVLKQTKASRGRGVTMLGPRSRELRDLRDELATADGGKTKKSHIVQRYITNEWTFRGHKCDLRVYVLVASVEPLVVYYHDGIVRTAVGLHDEENFDSRNRKAHLTNVSQNKQNRTAWEPVRTFDELRDELLAYVRRNDDEVPAAAADTDDPLGHVRNQIKRILGIVFAAFKSRINLDKVPVDNAFALMGADFVIDQNLKVWLLEMQLGPQLVGDNHRAKIALLQDVLTTTIDVVEEVYHKQARKEPLLPLETTGKFELVYFDQSYKFEAVEE